MKIKEFFKNKDISFFLDWGVKLASIGITGPATWRVAESSFGTKVHDAMALTILCALAVSVVEGVLLSNWLRLEYKKDALPQIKARYAITAFVMYIATLVVGVVDEGWLGIIFRVALLAALIGSGWDTYAETVNTIFKNMDKSVENSPKVRSKIRKLSEEFILAEALADSEIKLKMLEAGKLAQLHDIDLAANKQQQIADQRHGLELKAIPDQLEASVNPVNFTDFTPPLQLAPVRQVLVSKKSAPDDVDHRIVAIYQKHPGLSLRKVAELVGQSHTAVSTRIKDLEIFGLLEKVEGKVYAVDTLALPSGKTNSVEGEVTSDQTPNVDLTSF